MLVSAYSFFVLESKFLASELIDAIEKIPTIQIKKRKNHPLKPAFDSIDIAS